MSVLHSISIISSLRYCNHRYAVLLQPRTRSVISKNDLIKNYDTFGTNGLNIFTRTFFSGIKGFKRRPKVVIKGYDKKIYVKGTSNFDFNELELNELFSQFGNILYVRITETTESDCYAVIKFQDEKSVAEALSTGVVSSSNNKFLIYQCHGGEYSRNKNDFVNYIKSFFFR